MNEDFADYRVIKGYDDNKKEKVWIINKRSGKLLAEGYTVNVFVDKKTMKSTTMPESLRKALQG